MEQSILRLIPLVNKEDIGITNILTSEFKELSLQAMLSRYTVAGQTFVSIWTQIEWEEHRVERMRQLPASQNVHCGDALGIFLSDELALRSLFGENLYRYKVLSMQSLRAQ